MQMPNDSDFAELVVMTVEAIEHITATKLTSEQVDSLWNSVKAKRMLATMAREHLAAGHIAESVSLFDLWKVLEHAYVEWAAISYEMDKHDYVAMRGLSGVTQERGGGPFSGLFVGQLVEMGLPADPTKWSEAQADHLAKFVKANRRAKR